MKQVTLKLSDGSMVDCLVDVNKAEDAFGKPIILIYGPGSLIIQFFSKNFRDNNVLVICDDKWTSEKDKKPKNGVIDEIHKITVESEVKKITEVGELLQLELDNNNIGLLGFSSLAVMAIKIASVNPAVFKFVIGIGCPVYLLDKFFQNTLPTFLERSSNSNRVSLYDADQVEFQTKLKTGQLSPNSLTVAGWHSMRARFYAVPEQYCGSLENWRFGITQKIFDPIMRDHFFDELLPKLDVVNIIKDNPVATLLVFGDEDGIVPPTEEIRNKTWKPSNKYDNYTYVVYKNCGHYAMQESPKFDDDVKNFCSKVLSKQSRAMLYTEGNMNITLPIRRTFITHLPEQQTSLNINNSMGLSKASSQQLNIEEDDNIFVLEIDASTTTASVAKNNIKNIC